MKDIPWMIQRMTLQPFHNPNAKGVDSFFRMDYMGSSEFEGGTLAKALKAMRSDKQEIVIAELKDGERSAFYVGPKEAVCVAQAVFSDQINRFGSKFRFQDPTMLCYSYEAKKDWAPVGWWAIDQDRPKWAMFTKEEYAQKWKELVYG